MTRRALITGAVVGVLLAGFGYLNDWIFRLNMIVGNHVPISVFGMLIVTAIAVNPLIKRLGGRLALRSDELAVAVALTLVGCSIPGSGLMREFTQIMALPAHYNRVEPGWRENRVLEYAPSVLLTNKGVYDERIIGDYMSGALKDKANEILDFGAVPWRAWTGPVAAWAPLIVLAAIACICMSLIVHTQWSRHELLPYPIATFARAIITGLSPDGGSLWLSKAFRLGFGCVFALRLWNGLCLYFPEVLVPVRLSFSLHALQNIWPGISRASGWWRLFRPSFYPAVIAFAFLLSSEVSLSLGLTQVVFVPLLAVLAGFGVNIDSGQMNVGVQGWQIFGSAAAMGVVLLYGGRHYYWAVARRGLTFAGCGPGPEPYAVWAFRILLLSAAGFALLLVRLGLDWPLSIMLIGLILLIYVIGARISAECGVPHIEANWNALSVFVGLFGLSALGIRAFVITGLICAMFMVDLRESLMPFVVNGLKICDGPNQRMGRLGAGFVAVFVLGLAVAVPVTLAAVYTNGAPADGWARHVARYSFEQASVAAYRLRALGVLEASGAYTPLQRLANIDPRPGFLLAAGIGAGLVFLFRLLRMRLPRWPLHPVMFVMWGTWPMLVFSHSFLLGWLIKRAVMRFGGQRLYHRLFPAVVGVIAGDILGGLTFMIVGAVYYAVTGHPGPTYYVFAR